MLAVIRPFCAFAIQAWMHLEKLRLYAVGDELVHKGEEIRWDDKDGAEEQQGQQQGSKGT